MHRSRSQPRTSPLRRGFLSGHDRRAWLAFGLVGLLLLTAAPSIHELWLVNRAGIHFNRYLHDRQPGHLDSAFELLRGQIAGEPERQNASLWRTYGALARYRPSEESFKLLLAAKQRGLLDRPGELWLGEVAAATGHWKEAEDAYARVDATNLLIERGDSAIRTGRTDVAGRWYSFAQASLYAAIRREKAQAALDRRLGMTDRQAGRRLPADAAGRRAVALLRIGRGFLQLECWEEAVQAFEGAANELRADSPGLRERQSIYFGLAEALVGAAQRELGPEAVLPAEVVERGRKLVRRALDLDETSWSHCEAGVILSRLGDRAEAVSHLGKAIDLDPLSPRPYLALGAILEHDGLPSLARDLYQEGAGRLPGNRELLAAWATAAYRTMAVEKALPLLQRAEAAGARDPYVFAYQGDCYLRMGMIQQALASYDRGLKLMPNAKPLLERKANLPPVQGATP